MNITIHQFESNIKNKTLTFEVAPISVESFINFEVEGKMLGDFLGANVPAKTVMFAIRTLILNNEIFSNYLRKQLFP